MKLSQAKKQDIIDEMLTFLSKELGHNPPNNLLPDKKRMMINTLMLLQPPQNMGDYFYGLQDKLLADENELELDVNSIKFKHGCYEVKGTGLNTNADVYVYASGQLIPSDLVDNLDNLVLLKTGLQLKQEWYNQLVGNGFIINTTMPYITDGYNLNNKYLAKMVLGEDEGTFVVQLNNLFNFVKQNDIKHITICLIGIKIKDAKKIILKAKKQNKANCNIVFAG